MCPKTASTETAADRHDPAPDGTDAALPFEQALERLENRVAEMESGRLSLEDMLTAFEEGRRLAQHCHRKLNEVERRIEVLNRDAEGRETLTPFPDQVGNDADS